MRRSFFEDVTVVVKFFEQEKDGVKSYVSRTLGKLAVPHRDYANVVTANLWVAQIMREIRPGENRGIFVLRPIKEIEDESKIKKVIPGFYDVQMVNGNAALITPKLEPDAFWILSKNTRQLFKRNYAVIIPIVYDYETHTTDFAVETEEHPTSYSMSNNA